MKVLLLNQFFHPDHCATAQIETDLAEDLASSGMTVTALASRGTYLGGESLPRRERYGDVEIVRVAATSLGKRTLVHRAVDYASFYVTASAAIATLPRNDVVIALTTPPLIAATGLLAKVLKRSRLVYWVQDLYPDVAVAFGALRSRSPAARMMAAVSRAILRRADRVVTLGEAMRRLCIAAGARADRAVVIPNWSDAKTVQPVPHGRNRLRNELADGARLVVMYSGNMGRGHDMATLLDAARLLRTDREIRFVFAGDGARRGEVEAAARTLDNVRLVPYQQRDRLSESLSAGDVHLVALSEHMEGLLEPSKLYGIMAVGRPVLFVGPAGTEVARTVSEERCGVVIRNGDAPGLARVIRDLANDERARSEMGARARAALKDRYSRSKATAQFVQLLRTL